ncbi:MAG: ABC transporter permease [Nocardioides sp.]
MSPGRRRWTAPRSPTPRARRSTTAEGASRLEEPTSPGGRHRDPSRPARRRSGHRAGADPADRGRGLPVAAHQDYLLDNITNTLGVAAQDAAVAKRLFAFLGVPGALLAAVLAAYAGNVLAEAQRREHATLGVRGASRRHLLGMLVLRTALLTVCGAAAGLGLATWPRPSSWGRPPRQRQCLGAGGLRAGRHPRRAGGDRHRTVRHRLALHRSRDQRGPRSAGRPPRALAARPGGPGRAARLRGGHDLGTAGPRVRRRPRLGLLRALVDLRLWLLVLPVAIWGTGCLVGTRLLAAALSRAAPGSAARLAPLGRALVRRSVGRRPSAVGSAAVVVALIVAVGVSLSAFTASSRRRQGGRREIRQRRRPTTHPGTDVAPPYDVAAPRV